MKDDIKNKIEIQKGGILIVAVLIITSLALLLAISVNLAAIDELRITSSFQKGQKSEAITQACIDEAIIRLKRDNSYTGGSLNVNQDTCNIVISGNTDLRLIQATGEYDNYFTEIEVEVDLSTVPITINYWKKGF